MLSVSVHLTISNSFHHNLKYISLMVKTPAKKLKAQTYGFPFEKIFCNYTNLLGEVFCVIF